MDEKKSFGEYIRRKRQETGLTQRELAERLYVAESTVSKWERGLSYPDVALIPEVCRALSISEHEFFTACDDDKAAIQSREARAWQRLKKGWWWISTVSFALAVVICFICNLALHGRLDWFWIVLTGVLLAFSVTDLPLLIWRDRVPICLGAATVSLILLLWACWGYAGGWWVLGGLAITAAVLVLPWGAWAIWRFYARRVAPLVMAGFSLWLFLLLTVIWLFTGGDWLWRMGVPIAAFCLAVLWLIFAVIYWLPVNSWLKGGLTSLILTFTVPLANCLSRVMTPSQKVPHLRDYFAWDRLLTHESVHGFSWINVLVFAIMLMLSAVLLAVGVGKALGKGGKS